MSFWDNKRVLVTGGTGFLSDDPAIRVDNEAGYAWTAFQGIENMVKERKASQLPIVLSRHTLALVPHGYESNHFTLIFEIHRYNVCSDEVVTSSSAASFMVLENSRFGRSGNGYTLSHFVATTKI